MPIKLSRGQPEKWTIEFENNPMADFGLDYSDIENVTMNFKKSVATDADDLYLQKTSPNGVVWDEATHVFGCSVDSGDTDPLDLGNYECVLAVRVPGMARRIELDIEDPGIKLVTDKNRD